MDNFLVPLTPLISKSAICQCYTELETTNKGGTAS
jgi:hypothetical protein